MIDVVMGGTGAVDVGRCVGGHGWGKRLVWMRLMAQLLESVEMHDGRSGVAQTQDDAR